MKNNRGITLIALVITIIVLLILAGVSIAMLTGDNGILTQATTARDETADAEKVEKINMEIAALYSSALAQDNPKQFTQAEIKAAMDNLGTTDYTFTPATAVDSSSVRIEAKSDSSIFGTVSISSGNVTVEYAKVPADNADDGTD